MRHQGEHFEAGLSRGNVLGFKGGQHFIKSLGNATISKELIDIIMLQRSRAKPGNPASAYIITITIATFSHYKKLY